MRQTEQRRRIFLMRHGEVAYFDANGRPLGADEVPLTAAGIAQARAVGALLAQSEVALDRVICSGLPRTRATAEHVLAAAGLDRPVEVQPRWREIRGGPLAAIPDAELQRAFTEALDGGTALELRSRRFLGGESLGELLDRAIPALEALLADDSWDTVLLVLHGGVNRALLSFFLNGRGCFFGALAQDPGCLNVIDAARSAAGSVVRVLNYCPQQPLLTHTRQTTMEELLSQYQRYRRQGHADEESSR